MFHTIENPDVKMLQEVNLAKDQAEKANAAKTSFLSSMSHEIRTPLHAIKGYSETTEDAGSLEEAKENAREVIKASDILLDLINGVLDIAKIESGKVEIINVDYNLVELVNEVSKLVHIRYREKGLDFRIKIAPDIPKVLYGDKAHIQQILSNILINAHKYTDQGSVDLDIYAINHEDVCSIYIAVEDTGKGMQPKLIDNLFNKWTRAEDTRNSTTEGVGLGLAISYSLVEMMGGKITVQSVYGQGSKFTIALPQKVKDETYNTTEVFVPDKNTEEDAPLPKTNTPVTEVKETNGEKYGQGERILLVDDNQMNLNIAKKFLRNYNYEIIDCLSAKEGLDLIAKGEKFDLLLLDDMMPEISGTDMMKKLKAENYSVPMIVLTANAMVGEKEKYLAAGFDAYIGKPMSKQIFDEIIREFLPEENKIEEEPNKEITEESKEIPTESEESTPLNVLEPNRIDWSKEPTFIVAGDSDIVSEIQEQLTNKIETEPSVDKTVNKGNIAYLKQNAIDVDNALKLLGDTDIYKETMQIFYDSSEERIKEIDQCKKANDLTNYSILVHSLKSDAEYLGFTTLKDMALEHETESKANNIDYINGNYETLINEINKIIDICKEYLDIK